MATFRQKLAASKMVEFGGKMSMRRAMREAGYSEATAKNPQKLTRSVSWKEIIGEKLSDELLVDRLLVLINAKKTERSHKSSGKVVVTEREDCTAISRGLDMAFKIKGKYIADKEIPHDPFENLTYEELDAQIKELESSEYHQRYIRAGKKKEEKVRSLK